MKNQGTAASRRLYFRLQRTASRLRAVADVRCREAAGVSAAQAGALLVIASEEGSSQRRIAELLEQRETAVTTMIDRLEERGLVERRLSGTDGRAWAVHLTDAGRRAVSAIHTELRELNRSLDEALGPRVDAFADALSDIEETCGP